MVLSTHIVTGAAASRIFATHPVEGFFIGWVSHYLFDAVVHWDYPINSLEQNEANNLETKIHFNKAMVFDVGKVLSDVLLGFIVVILASRFAATDHISLLLAGGLGATAPDFIQFVYGIFKNKPLTLLQRFHNFMHSPLDWNDRPLIGVSTQLCIIALATVLLVVV